MDNIVNSPFKFLDPYGREDQQIFFGRDEEIKQLYQHIHKNRLVLVYGTSGTGKTSIVQCGLMNRMEDTDWTPFFIRRGDNLNDSLINNLKQSINTKQETETGVATALAGKTSYIPTYPAARVKANANICEQVYASLKSINLRYLRSVYLIFDQFEELLILGSEEEKKTFISIIDHILTDPELQFCSLLFIMREEFFAGLSDFEKEIPDFADRRLRIEPMKAKNVEEVITGSCEKFNITLEQGIDNARQIIKVLTEKNSISLPYLQIYLDQLWRSVYFTPPQKEIPEGSKYPALTFNQESIRMLGGMHDVLERFIRDRIYVIQDKLEKVYTDIPSDFVSNVLDCFVTSEGTKRPLTYMRINNSIWFTGQVPLYLQNRSGVLMISCLSELETNKILRTEGQTYELAHDVIAGLIDSRRTEEQRKLAFATDQIINRFAGFEAGTSDLLTPKEIEYYRPIIRQMNLPPKALTFYQDSITYQQKLEQERQDDEDKLKRMKERQRRMRWGWLAGGILLVAVTGLYFYSQMLRREFNRNESLVYMGYEMKKLDPVEAVNLFRPIKEKVYGEDTNKVNQKLLEFMQMQDIQSRFSLFTDTLQTSILEPGRIDISANGNYIVSDNSVQGNRSSAQDYVVRDRSGKVVRDFKAITYAYFMNQGSILLLCRRGEEEKNDRRKKSYYQTETILPTEFILYNCDEGTTDTIRLGAPRRYLHSAEDIQPGPFREFDSFRVRFTASGKLLIPYLEMNDLGELRDQVQIYDHMQQTRVAFLPSETTVTSSRDKSRFLTLFTPQDGYNRLNVYDEFGGLHVQARDVTFGDFTEDGALIWGSDTVIHVLNGKDSLKLYTHNYFTYAYGNIRKNRVIARMGIYGLNNNYQEVLELMDLQSRKRQQFNEILVATAFEKNAFITQTKSNWEDEDKEPHDTIRRRDLNGQETAPGYTHSEGFESVQYNSSKDEIIILTRKNKLILLNKDLKVKTGLQLTANDRFGLSANGEIIYYVRDQYLSVFRNNATYLNVFDPAMAWGLLEKPQLKRTISKQRQRDLGLEFR